MTSLPKAIITAFKVLGGEREIREIKDWISSKYGEKWKDIGTTMADMVPMILGGSNSSQISEEYRVLKRISRGRYCLLECNNNRVDLQKSKSNSNPSSDISKNRYENYKNPLEK